MSARPTVSPLAADRAARRSAQVIFDRPVVLEAGAGTGKTTALVARLLAWTLGAGWAELLSRRGELTDDAVAGALLDGVVAITFTDAAAAEMASRAQLELAQLADGGVLAEWLEPAAFPSDAETRARRARALLASIDRLRVQTIHSFALTLLRAHALEGGLHPALGVDPDEVGLAEIVVEVLAGELPQRYRAGDPALLGLSRAGMGPEALRGALVEMNRLGLTGAALATDPWTNVAAAAALDPAAAAAEELAAALAGARFRASATNSLALAEALPQLAQVLVRTERSRSGLADLAGDLDRLWPAGARKRIADWTRGAFNQGERAQLADLPAAVRAARRLDLALALLEQIDPELLDAARQVLGELAAEVQRRMRHRGLATYSDLLRLAVDLLAIPAVAREARRGIRQLLVDELQDTDELQCELVARLALEGPAAERPGLFLVGDPKQSIYGWRRARLANYLDFVDRALAGERAAPLSANFRSAAGLLAEVERLVAPLMSEPSDVAAPFAPLVATGDRVQAPGAIEYWGVWDAGSDRRLRAGEVARREAVAIARDLAERIRAGHIEPSQAAILLRATTQIERYLEALRQWGVPYAVEKDRSYFRRRETIDAAALVRAALDPADRLALAAWLRSPWVGVPDVALWPLWRERFPELVGAAVSPDEVTLAPIEAAIARAAAATPTDDPQLAPLADWPLALGAAARSLLERRAAFPRESADVWIDGLRRAFLPDLVAAARYQGAYRLANLDRFFRELGEELERGVPLHRLLGELRRVARERPDAPESRPLEGAGNAVRVMTLHSAKGLEFDEVYLAAVHHQPRGAGARAAVEAERVGGAWQYRLFGTPSPGLAPAADLVARIRSAEQIRLLYVGATRARHRLVVSGALPAAPAEVDPVRASSLADLLSSRVPERLPPAALEAAGFRDPHGALWRRLPPAADEPEAPPLDERAGTPVSELAAERALAELAARRAAALAHRDRPRVARATEVAALELEPADAEAAPWRAAPVADRSRLLALARGTALHRALELSLAAEADPARWRAATLASFERELGNADEEEIAALGRDLDRLLLSDCWTRLRALAPRVLARELPVLLAADASQPRDPLEAITGAIDLVYLGDDDGLVVADFKSDAVAETGVPALVERYAAQLALYARAVAGALGLDRMPATELWLLSLDRIVPVAPPQLVDPPAPPR